jgi:hypothetical protein
VRQINFEDKNLSLLQANVADAIRPLETLPIRGGNILTLYLTSGSDNLVEHGLGYTPQYVIVMTPDVQSDIWSPASVSLSNATANRVVINLRCSASCNVKVWVA